MRKRFRQHVDFKISLKEKRLKQLDGNRLKQGMDEQMSVNQVQRLFIVSLRIFAGLSGCRQVKSLPQRSLSQVKEGAAGCCGRCGITLRHEELVFWDDFAQRSRNPAEGSGMELHPRSLPSEVPSLGCRRHL